MAAIDMGQGGPDGHGQRDRQSSQNNCADVDVVVCCEMSGPVTDCPSNLSSPSEEKSPLELRARDRGFIYTAKEARMHVTGPVGLVDLSIVHHTTQHPDKPLSSDQVEQFRRDGFVVLPRAVAPIWVQRVREYVDSQYDSLLNQSVRQDDWRMHLLLKLQELPSPEDVEKCLEEERLFFSNHASHNEVRRALWDAEMPGFECPDADWRLSEHAPVLNLLLKSKKLLNAASQLMGSPLTGTFYNQLGYRTPLGPKGATRRLLAYSIGAEYHIDGQANSEGTRFPDPWTVLAAVALVDLCSPLQGNFTVWKGSHLCRDWSNYPSEKVTKTLPSMGEATHVTMHAGDVVLAHVLLPHRGGKNVSAIPSDTPVIIDSLDKDMRDQMASLAARLGGDPSLLSEEERPIWSSDAINADTSFAEICLSSQLINGEDGNMWKPLRIEAKTREMVFFRLMARDINYASPERSVAVLSDPLSEHNC